MPDRDGEMSDDTNSSRPSDNTATLPQQAEVAGGGGGGGPSNQWNVDVPMESDAMMEPPGVSTGARRRDPRPPISKPRSSSSQHDRQTSPQRNRHYETTGTKEMGTISIPINFTGVLMCTKSNGLSYLEQETGVVIISVKDTDGFNTDLTIYGTSDEIALAQEKVGDVLLNASKNSSELHEQVAFSQSRREQANKSCNVILPVVEYKPLCEMLKKYRQKQIANLPSFVKDFYHEDPLTASMSSEAANKWRKVYYNMQVRRNSLKADNLSPIPNPELSLEHLFGFQMQILRVLYNHGITRPSPVQSQAWPILLRGDDFICVAPSGTGKTLAVLLTALIHANGQPRTNRNGPSALILAPCRKMVTEMQNHLSNFQFLGIKYVCLYKEEGLQLNLLSGSVDIVIATPSKLNDLAMVRHFKPELFSFVALIEIDSMIEIGYESIIKKVLLNTRPGKQMVMTCAKWAMPVRLMSLLFMADPIQLKLDIVQEAVTQRVQLVEKEDRENVIIQYLTTNIIPDAKVVVYCQRPDTAENIGVQLIFRDIYCRYIYGDLTPSEREAALNDVDDGSVNILLVSDVACRYVNLHNLTLVINFEYPGLEEYIDRLNRTSRAGIVLTWVTKNDYTFARDLVMILREAGQEVPDELEKIARRLEALPISGRGAICGGCVCNTDQQDHE